MQGRHAESVATFRMGSLLVQQMKRLIWSMSHPMAPRRNAHRYLDIAAPPLTKRCSLDRIGTSVPGRSLSIWPERLSASSYSRQRARHKRRSIVTHDGDRRQVAVKQNHMPYLFHLEQSAGPVLAGVKLRKLQDL